MPIPEENARDALIKLHSPDLEILAQFQREWWGRYAPLQFRPLDREATEVDELYNEAIVRTPVETEHSIPAAVQPNPSRQRLEKYGIRESRDLIVSLSTILLDDRGLLENSSQFLIGWLFRFDGDVYEIMSQHRPAEAYWAQTNIPLYYECTAKRHRSGV